MNTQILSSITGEPVAVRFAMVGRGKSLHYSPSNDETLCGRMIGEYVSESDHKDAPLCKRCATVERMRSEEYAATRCGGDMELCAVARDGQACDCPLRPSDYEVTLYNGTADAHTGTEDVVTMIPAGPVMVPVLSVQLDKDGMPDMGIYGATLEESGVSIGIVSKRSKTAHFIVEGVNAFCGKTVQYVNGVSRDAAITSGVNVCGICRTAQRVQWEHYNAARVEMLAAMTEDAETDMIVSEDAAETSLMIAETLGNVVVEGVDPSEFAPDFDASGAAECYFGCGVTPVAVFVDYVGRTEGLCAAHRDRVEGKTYELPTVSTGDAETDAETIPAHVFVPGMHALDMGSGAYNRFVGIGESQGVPGSLFTFGLATAISAHPGMSGTGKINRECEFGDVIMVRTSLGDVQYVVADNRYGTDGPRQGDPILYPYTLEDAKCYVCQVHGDNAAPGKSISGEWVCGFCLAFDVTPEKLNSHALSFYVETERTGVKFECDQCGAIDSRHGFGRIMCEGIENDTPKLSILDLVPSEKISALAAHIVETQHNVNTCDAFECERCAGVLYARCQESHTGTECVACAAYERFGFLVIYRGTDAFESDDTDGGFVETMITKEYDLSVVVDENTGARVSLGWVTLTMNAAQCMDWDAVAEEYGRTYGTGTPRHGWASIITVHDVADI